MWEAVADCDDGSSDGSLMLLSPPRDIPEAELPAGSAMEIGTRDADSPVVMPRRVTPESTSATPRGRPPGCFYTTTRDVGARFMHREFKSAVANGPPANGSTIAPHRCGYLLMAGG